MMTPQGSPAVTFRTGYRNSMFQDLSSLPAALAVLNSDKNATPSELTALANRLRAVRLSSREDADKVKVQLSYEEETQSEQKQTSEFGDDENQGGSSLTNGEKVNFMEQCIAQHNKADSARYSKTLSSAVSRPPLAALQLNSSPCDSLQTATFRADTEDINSRSKSFSNTTSIPSNSSPNKPDAHDPEAGMWLQSLFNSNEREATNNRTNTCSDSTDTLKTCSQVEGVSDPCMETEKQSSTTKILGQQKNYGFSAEICAEPDNSKDKISHSVEQDQLKGDSFRTLQNSDDSACRVTCREASLELNICDESTSSYQEIQPGQAKHHKSSSSLAYIDAMDHNVQLSSKGYNEELDMDMQTLSSENNQASAIDTTAETADGSLSTTPNKNLKAMTPSLRDAGFQCESPSCELVRNDSYQNLPSGDKRQQLGISAIADHIVTNAFRDTAEASSTSLPEIPCKEPISAASSEINAAVKDSITAEEFTSDIAASETSGNEGNCGNPGTPRIPEKKPDTEDEGNQNSLNMGYIEEAAEKTAPVSVLSTSEPDKFNREEDERQSRHSDSVGTFAAKPVPHTEIHQKSIDTTDAAFNKNCEVNSADPTSDASREYTCLQACNEEHVTNFVINDNIHRSSSSTECSSDSEAATGSTESTGRRQNESNSEHYDTAISGAKSSMDLARSTKMPADTATDTALRSSEPTPNISAVDRKDRASPLQPKSNPSSSDLNFAMDLKNAISPESGISEDINILEKSKHVQEEYQKEESLVLEIRHSVMVMSDGSRTVPWRDRVEAIEKLTKALQYLRDNNTNQDIVTKAIRDAFFENSTDIAQAAVELSKEMRPTIVSAAYALLDALVSHAIVTEKSLLGQILQDALEIATKDSVTSFPAAKCACTILAANVRSHFFVFDVQKYTPKLLKVYEILRDFSSHDKHAAEQIDALRSLLNDTAHNRHRHDQPSKNALENSGGRKQMSSIHNEGNARDDDRATTGEQVVTQISSTPVDNNSNIKLALAPPNKLLECSNIVAQLQYESDDLQQTPTPMVLQHKNPSGSSAPTPISLPSVSRESRSSNKKISPMSLRKMRLYTEEEMDEARRVALRQAMEEAGEIHAEDRMKLESRVHSLENERDELRTILSEFEDTMTKMVAQENSRNSSHIKILEAERNSLKGELLETTEAFTHLKDRYEAIKLAKAEAEARENRLQAQSNELKTSMIDLQKWSNDLKANTEKKLALSFESASRHHDLYVQAEAREAAANKNLDIKTKELALREQELIDAKTRVSELAKALTATEHDMKRQNQELLQAQKQISVGEAKQISFKKEIASLREKLLESENAAAALVKAGSSTKVNQVKLDALSAENQTLKARAYDDLRLLQDMEKQLGKKGKECEELNSICEELLSKLEKT